MAHPLQEDAEKTRLATGRAGRQRPRPAAEAPGTRRLLHNSVHLLKSIELCPHSGRLVGYKLHVHEALEKKRKARGAQGRRAAPSLPGFSPEPSGPVWCHSVPEVRNPSWVGALGEPPELFTENFHEEGGRVLKEKCCKPKVRPPSLNSPELGKSVSFRQQAPGPGDPPPQLHRRSGQLAHGN